MNLLGVTLAAETGDVVKLSQSLRRDRQTALISSKRLYRCWVFKRLSECVRARVCERACTLQLRVSRKQACTQKGPGLLKAYFTHSGAGFQHQLCL